MKTSTIVGAMAVSAVLSLYGANGLAGVTSAGDAICTVSDSVVMSNGIAIVDYVLKPEAESHIRCRIALPPPEKWNGEFCRLFALPGHAHGGGKGRISTAGGYTIKHLDLLRKWVEEGKAPESYPQRWEEMKLTLPIPPYPFMCYQDDDGNWKTKRYPEGMVRRPDPAYMP